jgi:hypothetical protein
MSHLTLEDLARLVDEAGAPEERAHLGRCSTCRGELESMMEEREALAALPDLAPSPDGWPALRRQLRREGLIRERRMGARAAGQLAAALAVFIAGGALGYAVRGPTAAPARPFAVVPGPAADERGPGAEAIVGGGAREPDAAEEMFIEALDRFMASAGVAPADPATRLAALDNIVLTTAEALNEAPADPVISGYHLSALAQRDAVLRQLTARSGQPVF